MKKMRPIIIEDSKEIKNVFIRVDLKNGSTMIMSNFSAWENLALILEGLAATAEQCMKEGMPREEVYDAIKKYIVQALPAYKIKE